MVLSRLALVASCAIALGFSSPSLAQSDVLSAGQKAEIEKMIGDYLLANPGIVRDALMALERQQLAEQEAQQQDAIASKADDILRSEFDYVAGNVDGDVTLVEFFDYNCGYCKRALADMNALLESDKNLRIVLKEFPILSQGSLEAAQLAIAARKQGKYLEFHQALLLDNGRMDGARALQIAEELGLDPEQLKKDSATPEVRQSIQAAHGLATDLGINGTPAYLIGNEIIPGAIGALALGEKIAALRAERKNQSN